MAVGLLEDAESLWAGYFWAVWEAGEWETLPEEERAYGQQHLAEHLDAASLPEGGLRDLISGDWMRAWERMDGTHAGFLKDVARAWRQAEASLHSVPPGGDLAAQARFALWAASASALRTNAPAVLPALAIRNEALTPTQALALALQIASERQRAKALIGLAPHLPAELLPEALAGVQVIVEEWARAQALAGLAPFLPAHLAGEALRATRGIQSESYRAAVLAALAPYLSGHRLRAALEAAAEIEVQSYRAEAVVGLAAGLPPELYPELFEIAQGLEDGWPRGQALVALAEAVPAFAAQTGIKPERLFSQLLDSALSIKDEWVLSKLISGLEPHLTTAALRRAFKAALSLAIERPRLEALLALSPRLPPRLLKRVLEQAQAEEKGWLKQELLAGLAPYLTSRQVSQALEMARGLEKGLQRATALAALAPRLSQRRRARLLKEILDVKETVLHSERDLAGNWFEIMAGLVQHFNRRARRRILSEAADALRSHSPSPETLLRLAPGLLPELFWPIIRAVQNLSDSMEQAKALAALGPYLGIGDVLVALQVAERLPVTVGLYDNPRAYAFTELAQFLYLDLRMEALKIALDDSLSLREQIALPSSPRAQALAELAPRLPPELLGIALAAVQDIRFEGARAQALAGLAPHLPPDLLLEAQAIAFHIQDGPALAEAMTALAPYLSPAQALQAVQSALGASQAIGDMPRRARALIQMAPYLSPSLLPECMEAAESLEDPEYRLWALVDLVPHLPEALHRQAAQGSLDLLVQMGGNDLHDQRQLGQALAALAAHLPPDLFGKALEVALQLPENDNLRSSPRAAALTALAALPQAPHFPAGERGKLLAEALSAVGRIQDENARARGLGKLAPHLDDELLAQALEKAGKIEKAEARAEALIGVAPFLPPRLLGLAYEAACALSLVQPRVGVEDYFYSDRVKEGQEAGARAQTGLLPYLPESQLINARAETLALVQALPEEDSWGVRSPRILALARLAPHLPPEMREKPLMEALAVARQLQEFAAQPIALRAPALIALVPHLPPDQQAEVVREALETVKRAIGTLGVQELPKLGPYFSPGQIKETFSIGLAVGKAEVLAELVPSLPADQLFTGIRNTLQVAKAEQRLYLEARQLGKWEFHNQSDWVRLLEKLSPYLEAWARAQPETAYEAWKLILRAQANFGRPVLLESLPALLPFAQALDPYRAEETAEGVFRAVQEVSKWWL